MNLGTKHPLIVRNVTVNTTLSGGGQPPSPRRPTRLVGIMSLATGLLRLSVSKVALSRDIDRRTVYRISNRYPLSDSGTAYSGRLPTLEPALDVGYLQLVICRRGGKKPAKGYRRTGHPLIPGFLYSPSERAWFIQIRALLFPMTKKYVSHLTGLMAGHVCR